MSDEQKNEAPTTGVVTYDVPIQLVLDLDAPINAPFREWNEDERQQAVDRLMDMWLQMFNLNSAGKLVRADVDAGLERLLSAADAAKGGEQS